MNNNINKGIVRYSPARKVRKSELTSLPITKLTTSSAKTGNRISREEGRLAANQMVCSENPSGTECPRGVKRFLPRPGHWVLSPPRCENSTGHRPGQSEQQQQSKSKKIQEQKDQISPSTISTIIQQEKCLSKTINLIIHPTAQKEHKSLPLKHVALSNIRYKAHYNAQYSKSYWSEYWRKKRDYPCSVKHYVETQFKFGNFSPTNIIDQIDFLDQQLKHIGCG